MTKIKDLVEKYGDREIDEVELEKILKPVKVKTIYNLEKGDIYYSITESGLCTWHMWDNDGFDNKICEFGNVFITREDAKFEIEYLKVKAELKRYASMCEEPIDWHNKEQKKYSIEYYHTEKVLNIDFEWVRSLNNIYFTDVSVLLQAIEEIGEERIIKYYLGIKGENK